MISNHPPNRLAKETSPYLLQHSRNPVDWYSWGEEALARARNEDRLILLSIGYSTCHWCHVMERESFENEAIAGLMNEHFVCVKVDREERPDLDDVYMAATLALNQGQGGWPMTVFLTPELEPVFAGTYFPPDDRYGRPGFPSLLRRLSVAWRERRSELVAGAAHLVEHLRAQATGRSSGSIGEAELRRVLQQYSADFDPIYGGFGEAPKFPPATGLSLLLRLHRQLSSADALIMVTRTLEGMAHGGLYDQVGGGFCRYSTDAEWLVPHFEKMLYDNALLTPVYLEAFQVTGRPLFARIAGETLDYVLAEMTSEEGGFYSATDADSEGEEGKFFVWTPEEITAVLDGPDGILFCSVYDVTPQGNWEGKSIPRMLSPLPEIAERLGVNEREAARRLLGLRRRVLEARRLRVPPGLDDKVLTAWNGMMLHAMCEGHRVLREQRYLDAAGAAARFLWRQLRDGEGRLLRSYRAGVAHLPAYLDDHAFLAEGLVSLYEVTGDREWLDAARQLCDVMLAEFRDPESGGFFTTCARHEELPVRLREGHDGAVPAANAVAASALARLSVHLDRQDYRAEAIAALEAHGEAVRRYPRAFARALCVTDFLLSAPLELAFVAAGPGDDLEDLLAAGARPYLPNRVQSISRAAEASADLPLLAGKAPLGGRATLFVCRDHACQAPIVDPMEVPGAVARPPNNRLRQLTRPLAGRATPESTRRIVARHPQVGFVELPGSAVWASRIGFGSYRIDDSTSEHADALRSALRAGCNLIDTSTNYTDGASERIIGRVLRELVGSAELQRDEVIVVSKIGYLQGGNLAFAKERRQHDGGYLDIVELSDGLWHCIHPRFLRDQLTASLDRLGLESLDICLLHNPEYYLEAAHRSGIPVESARDQLYDRVATAFQALEDEVTAGRLGAYGVSSNTLVAAADHPAATDLERFLQAAQGGVGPNHHFSVLQLPLNLLEPGAVVEQRHAGRSACELAATAGLALLVNRPLNAIVEGRLIRLADPPEVPEAAPAAATLEKLRELDEEFAGTWRGRLESAGLRGENLLGWADQLAGLAARLEGLPQWQPVETQVWHGTEQLLTVAARALGSEPAWREFATNYRRRLQDALQSLRAAATAQSRRWWNEIRLAVDPRLAEARRSESLSRKALGALLSVPGVTVALCGMRHPRYVADALPVSRWPAIGATDELFRVTTADRTINLP